MFTIPLAVSSWLWAGIFLFIYLVLSSKKEIEEAELESLHLCVIFIICSIFGVPILFYGIFNNKKSDSRRKVELLEEIKEDIDILLAFFRK